MKYIIIDEVRQCSTSGLDSMGNPTISSYVEDCRTLINIEEIKSISYKLKEPSRITLKDNTEYYAGNNINDLITDIEKGLE